MGYGQQWSQRPLLRDWQAIMVDAVSKMCPSGLGQLGRNPLLGPPANATDRAQLTISCLYKYTKSSVHFSLIIVIDNVDFTERIHGIMLSDVQCKRPEQILSLVFRLANLGLDRDRSDRISQLNQPVPNLPTNRVVRTMHAATTQGLTSRKLGILQSASLVLLAVCCRLFTLPTSYILQATR